MERRALRFGYSGFIQKPPGSQTIPDRSTKLNILFGCVRTRWRGGKPYSRLKFIGRFAPTDKARTVPSSKFFSTNPLLYPFHFEAENSSEKSGLQKVMGARGLETTNQNSCRLACPSATGVAKTCIPSNDARLYFYFHSTNAARRAAGWLGDVEHFGGHRWPIRRQSD